MSELPKARGASVALASLLLLILAGADGLSIAALLRPGASEVALETLARLRAGDLSGGFHLAATAGILPWLAIPTLGPLLLVPVLALSRGRGGGSADTARDAGSSAADDVPRAPARPEPPSPAVGLRLLAALQEDARLIDFVREDIASYTDEQVGSAVRGIHAALGKAIDSRVSIEPILSGEDGDPVEVPAGFDPALIRVTGTPAGDPPYRGVLRHGGWRAVAARLPVPTEGSDPMILVPAEVEVEVG
jgi:Domain of unknown function (DUF2760)